MLAAAGDHEIELVPGAAGVFEIEVDGKVKFSKKTAGRFPTDEEIAALV